MSRFPTIGRLPTIDALLGEVLEGDRKARELLAEATPRTRIAATLVRLRRLLNLSQRDVAERLERPQSTVARLEKPIGNIQTSEALAAYAKACGLTAGLIFLREEGDRIIVFDAVALNDDPVAEHFLASMVGSETRAVKDTAGSVHYESLGAEGLQLASYHTETA